MAVPTDPYPDFVPGTLADPDKVDARFKPLYDALAALDLSNMAAGYNPLLTPQGRLRLRYGTSSVTVPNGAQSANVAVGHGLGTVPVFAVAVSTTGAGGAYQGTSLAVIALDATNITVQGQNLGGYASGQVVTFMWLAIGT